MSLANGINPEILGTVNVVTASATTAGGLAIPAMSIGAANLGIYFGSGAPTISAPQGSLYLRTNGTTLNDRLYVNTNGTTGWAGVTTVA